jgi:NAD(P)-dependent dehydrogenase (short-subunit alcohol dehydrogenase family)
METTASSPLFGKVALVTGAARNIGRAVAERLSRDGAKVALLDVDAAVEVAARELGHSADVIALRADVNSATDVDRCFHEVVARWQRLDILVNNAAITRGSVRHFLEGDEAWWDEVVGVNLKGQFLCARRAAPLMAAQGSGVIISMSSGGATRAHRGMAAYDASKGGSEALTRALALDLAPYGVRAVAIVPGLIRHEGQAADSVRAAADTVPLARMGAPADIAAAAAFLASDDAAYITGATIVVDGGLLAQQRSPQAETFPVSSFPTLSDTTTEEDR